MQGKASFIVKNYQTMKQDNWEERSKVSKKEPENTEQSSTRKSL
jgi:hypothetical protein